MFYMIGSRRLLTMSKRTLKTLITTQNILQLNALRIIFGIENCSFSNFQWFSERLSNHETLLCPQHTSNFDTHYLEKRHCFILKYFEPAGIKENFTNCRFPETFVDLKCPKIVNFNSQSENIFGSKISQYNFTRISFHLDLLILSYITKHFFIWDRLIQQSRFQKVENGNYYSYRTLWQIVSQGLILPNLWCKSQIHWCTLFSTKKWYSVWPVSNLTIKHN